jgi:hypothetical protein
MDAYLTKPLSVERLREVLDGINGNLPGNFKAKEPRGSNSRL